MKTLGYDQPVYILPFDHRGSFVTKMFGWHGGLTAAQTAEIAVAKQVIYDGFKTAITEGVPKNKAGILVDEQFGAAILRDAKTDGFTTACPAEKSGLQLHGRMEWHVQSTQDSRMRYLKFTKMTRDKDDEKAWICLKRISIAAANQTK